MTGESCPEAVEDELDPQVVVPAQFFPPPARLLTPEHRMWAAVLQDAVSCFLAGKGARRVLARRWILESPRQAIGSFVFCCDILDIDWTAARREVLKAARGQVRAPIRRRDAGIRRHKIGGELLLAQAS